MFGGGDKLVAASQSFIYTSADYGSTWVSNNVPIKTWERVVSSANGSTLFAYEIGYYNSQLKGSIYASTNSGVTWAATSVPQEDWGCLACSADGTKVVAGPSQDLSFNAAPLYFSSDSGVSWTSNTTVTGYWNAIASSADGEKLVATSAYSIYTSTDGGITWTSNNAPQNYWKCVGSCADGSKLAATSSVDGDQGLYISQSRPSPHLYITPSNGNVDVSWVVPSTNFVLQQSLGLISWSDVTNTPTLDLTDLRNQITLSTSNRIGFYRLASPP